MRIFALMLSCIALFSSGARAEFYTHHWEDHHAVDSQLTLIPQISFYSTDANFTDGRQALLFTADGTKYSRTWFDGLLRYGISQRFTLFGRLNVTKITDPASRSTTGLGDQTIGLNYRAMESPSGLALDLQLQVELPTYNNLEAKDKGAPFLSDGSTDVSIGGFVSAPFMNRGRYHLLLTGGLGYTYRTENYSAAIPYSIAVGLESFQSGLEGEIGFFGVHSLKTDITLLVLSDEATRVGSSGSEFIDGLNPSITNLRTRVGYRFSPTGVVLAELGLGLIGQNAPKGMWFGVLAKFDLGETAHRGSVDSDDEDEPKEKKRRKKRKRSKESADGSSAEPDFTSYGAEAEVMRVSERLNLLKVNKGASDGVDKGQTFDVFEPGSNEPIARAKVVRVKSDSAVLRLKEFKKEVRIQKGFVVRQSLK